MKLFKSIRYSKLGIAVIALTSVIVVFFFYWIQVPIKEIDFIDSFSTQSGGELNDGKIFEYRYTTVLNSITDIEMPIGTYFAMKSYPVYASLKYEDGTVFEEWILEPNKEGNGDFNHSHHLKIPYTEKNLILSFYSEAPVGQGTTLLITKGDKTERGIMTMNGEVLPGDLSVEFRNEIASPFKQSLFSKSAVTIALIALAFSYISIFLIFIVNKKLSWNRCAFFLIIMLGLLYMLIITPYGAYDEAYHISNSEALSDILLFNNDELVKSPVRPNNADFTFVSGRNVIDGYLALPLIFSPEYFQGSYEVNQTDLAVYPIMFLPQAIGISVGRLLSFNNLAIFYLGRLFNLLFFATVISFAVKTVPQQIKIPFTVLSITPQILNIAASYNSDNFLNAIVALFIAYVLKYIFEDVKMSNRSYAFIIMLAMLFSPAKVIYFPIVTIFMLIPADRFSSLKSKAVKTVGIFAVSLFMIGVFSLSAINGSVGTSAETAVVGWEGTPSYSISWFLSNPIGAIELVFSTLAQKGNVYLTNAFAGFVGSAQVKVPEIATYLILFIVVMVLIGSFKDELDLKLLRKQQKFFILSIVVVCSVLVLMSMLAWTSINYTAIEGVQGRYFIPIIFLISVIVKGRAVIINPSMKNFMVISLVFINIFVIMNTVLYTLG